MYDIIVVGSGPAGLSAAIYGMRAGKKVLVIEKDYEGTGQIALSSKVDNYLGYYDIDGYSLGEHFRAHALHLGTEIKNGTVLSITKADDTFHVIVKVRKKEEKLEAKSLVYCAGAHHRLLQVEGENEFRGMGVSYCATCDGNFFTGRPVVVVGGGDTALDDALYLSDIASHVTLVHRREAFRGSYATLEKLREKENVTIVTGVNVVSILGENKVEKVLLDNGNEIETSAVFVAVGMIPDTGLVKDLADRDPAGYIIAGEDGRSSCRGLYAAGDVRTKELRQVITAAADGANAIHSIIQDM